MSDRDPDTGNPLAPYYPSEVPALPGNGRAWVALALSAMLLLGAAWGVLSLFVTV
jgi:hypothetical protein